MILICGSIGVDVRLSSRIIDIVFGKVFGLVGSLGTNFNLSLVVSVGFAVTRILAEDETLAISVFFSATNL